MTIRPSTIEQSVGRIEGQLEGVAATLRRLDTRGDARDDEIRALREDISDLMVNAADMVKVKKDFNALQQFIHDGKMQSKGVMLGITLTAGAGGAVTATFFKNIWTWILNLFGS